MRDAVYQTLNSHIPVSCETLDRLLLYHDLLLKWQNKVNLIGPDTIAEIWTRHFLDSLQLLKYIPTLSARIVDLGSGAGFPGMALAIAGAGDMHLIESDTKKVAFLREAARITHTNVNIHHARIEDVTIGNIAIITSRACSNLEALFTLSRQLISYETVSLFHKGKNYTKEIEDASKRWHFDHAILPSVTDNQGVILKIRHLRKRGV